MEHHTCKEQSLTPEVIVKQETGNIISGMDGVLTYIPTVQIMQGSGITANRTAREVFFIQLAALTLVPSKIIHVTAKAPLHTQMEIVISVILKTKKKMAKVLLFLLMVQNT